MTWSLRLSLGSGKNHDKKGWEMSLTNEPEISSSEKQKLSGLCAQVDVESCSRMHKKAAKKL
jgi:hypothetical protein